MSSLLPVALAYLARGWSPIPVGVDKRPLINWKEFQARRATPEELVKWFAEFPDAQVGITTGELSNLTVIDVEADGDFSLIKDETFVVETGGKGRHYYFQYEKEFKNAVRIFPSVDIRSTGGYVVAAGSTTSRGPYMALNSTKVNKMADNTKKMLLEAHRAKKELPWNATSGTTLYPKVDSAEGLAYSGSTEGGRNDGMTKFAGTIHAKLHPSLWPSIGWEMFEKANHQNVPPLPPYELRVIWNSIGSRETTQNPGGRDYTPYVSHEKTWGPAPDRPVSTSTEHRYADSLADESDQNGIDSKETLHASEVAAAQIIDTDHTYPLDMKPFDDALLGGFTLGDLIVVCGASGSGKTTIIQDWTVTLASGGQTGREKLPTLWFSYEVLAKPLWQKFVVMGATADTPIYLPRYNESGEIPWLVDVIEGAIQKWGIKVVAIDHIGFLRAPKGNYANAADAITHTVRTLKQLAVKRGLIILLPVHQRKTTSKIPDLNDVRDSLGIVQEASSVFFIGREKDDSGLQTSQAKLWLVKNRKTGVAVSAMFDMQFGRYFYSESETTKRVEQEDELAVMEKVYDEYGK